MKTIIIEDEKLAAERLKEIINEIDPSIEIADTLSSVEQSINYLKQNKPDLIFLDIQLEDGLSFSIFDKVEIDVPIIFTTAYDEFAVQAFKVNGVDYLLKPVNEDELLKAINKCKSIIKKDVPQNADLNAILQSYLNKGVLNSFKEKFIVNIRNQWMPVNVKDIACFSKETLNYVYLFSGERYQIDYNTLDEVEELLDPQLFYRANRQIIISVEAIQTVKPVENSKLIIKLKEPNHKIEIDMSRLKSPEFKKWMDR